MAKGMKQKRPYLSPSPALTRLMMVSEFQALRIKRQSVMEKRGGAAAQSCSCTQQVIIKTEPSGKKKPTPPAHQFGNRFFDSLIPIILTLSLLLIFQSHLTRTHAVEKTQEKPPQSE